MIHSYSKIKTDRKYNEDFKTYATLGVLQFLPVQLFWKLLKNAVVCNQDLPSISGEILKIDFWPKWYKVQNIKAVQNTTYIEPDVFIRFENFDCIVEVKKTDLYGQHADQWGSQVQAYRNEFPENRRLVYIALGGNHNLDISSHETFHKVYKSTWYRLLREIDIALRERIALSCRTEAINQECRILQAAIEAFARYNEYVVELLDTMNGNHRAIKLPTHNIFNQLWKI